MFTFLLDRYVAVRWGRGRHCQGPDGQSREERCKDHTARGLCHCWQVWWARHHWHCDHHCWHPRWLDGETLFQAGMLASSRLFYYSGNLLFRVWTVDQRVPKPTARPWPGPSRLCGTVRSVCLSGTTSPKGQRVWWTTWSRWPKKAVLQSSVRKTLNVRRLF